ncbi:MAG: hypothetical protein JKX81_13920 [Arenicella sp.]|nr:hypothetical protein [Arenicella sp.]
MSKTQALLKFFAALLLTPSFNITAIAQEPYVYNSNAGKINYMLQCQGCHKASGEGVEGSIPDMSVHGINMLSSERGRQFFVAVPGSSQSPLSDQHLADVLNYISIDLLESAKNNRGVSLFDTLEVAKYRGIKMKDVAKERAQIISDIERLAD